MPADNDDLAFASEFPPATQAMWLKLVESVLKGAPFDQLVSKTVDGVPIGPIYSRPRNARVIAGREAGAPWQIMQRIDHPDPIAANRQAQDDLKNGATGLTLVFAGANGAAGLGLPPTRAAIDHVFRDIDLRGRIALDFQIGPQSREAPLHFAAMLAEHGIQPGRSDVRFGFDPIGAVAVWGSSPYSWTQIAPALAGAVMKAAEMGFMGPTAVADGRAVHDAGGSEAQELAFVLSTGVAYLRALEAGGLPLAQARDMIYARLSADANQFLTMAKFRALRKLWARVQQACGLAPAPIFIAAETAWRMLTRRDTTINMLRATMATFAAGLGGADSITVLPHTLALGLPDAFARRIARNTQLILLKESHLAEVADPAAGSGGVEALTSELCQRAWALFQEIEAAGGIWAALESNLLQKQVAEVRAARQRNVALRSDVITGVSEFADLNESAPAVLTSEPVVLPSYGEATFTFDALTPFRLSEPFEALRDRSDALLTQTGARPKVFLANLGTPADFSARTTFAKSFFEAGGIEATDNDGFANDAALAAAFKASGAKIACLCASDKIHGTRAATAAAALTSAGATHIYLAGRPGDAEAAYRAAGIGDFIYEGADAAAILQAAYDKLESPRG